MNKINWSNYSKSTVAVAMDNSVAPSQFPRQWHEFILIPQSNGAIDDGCGFWTLLGESAEVHSQLIINPKYQPVYTGSWKKSLHIRPEIEQEIFNQLKVVYPANEWDEAMIDCVNGWLQYNQKTSMKDLQSTRNRLADVDKQWHKRREKEEVFICAEDEERIG